MIGSDPNPSTRDSNAPPSDDYCPICWGPFIIPSRTQCGHSYCAGCILRWWNHDSEPCKCPMCSRPISKLTTVTSMHHLQEEGVTEVLENIWKYNHLFTQKQKALVLPLIIKRIIRDMVNPDRALHHLHKLCFVAISLAALYCFCSFDFPKTGDLSAAVDFFDYCTTALVVILYLIGLCRIRRLQDGGFVIDPTAARMRMHD